MAKIREGPREGEVHVYDGNDSYIGSLPLVGGGGDEQAARVA